MVNHESWRSVIADYCDLNDLRSHGAEVRDFTFPLLRQVACPSQEQPEQDDKPVSKEIH